MTAVEITSRHTTAAILFAIFQTVRGQDGPASPSGPEPCGYGSGAIVTAVLLTFFCTLLLFAAFLYLWKRRQDGKKATHLILESDPETGVKAEYAFDNPGFKDISLVAATEKISKPEGSAKTKWGNWSPLSALTLKPEKKRALDDLALENHEVKVVSLKSQDFTGLGFNICGNMKEGIYIKDILHRGPAFESGKLNPGDRINSVTISFEHMVYEDALTILSYASPYEVMIEAKSGRIISYTQGQGQNPIHPIYRSSSLMNLFQTEKSAKKKLFGDEYSSGSNYSSLQKSRSNVTTLERKESKSPRPNQSKPKKVDRSPHKMTPEMLKTHLEQRMSEEDLRMKDDLEKIDFSLQKPENKGQKCGIKVLPMEIQQKSPKIIEQNQNNMNIEKNMEEITIRSIDEVDVNKPQPPQARKREKKSPEPAFERNDSGIKRDRDGIPLEIPDHMLGAAVVARRNRKSSTENGLTNGEDISRKTKGKAPSPPAEVKLNFTLGAGKTQGFEDLSSFGTSDSSPVGNSVRYGSDSEEDTDNNMSSVNTIELNSSDITIHQTEEEERKARKTASTGDLSKMQKTPRSNTGTLERAQSLDITDTSGPSLVKMRTYDATENLLIDREPRLSLILDGLTTFQRNRLKKSTEWGDLEDAILNFNREDEEYEQRRKSEPQFNAVMDRVIQIKRESGESEILPDEIVRQYHRNALEEPKAPKVFNRIWPDEEEINEVKFEDSGWKRLDPKEEIPKRSLKSGKDLTYMRRQQVPVAPERTKIKVNETLGEPKLSGDTGSFSIEEKHEKESGEKVPLPAERVSRIDLVLEGSPKSMPSNSPTSNSPMHIPNQPKSQISVEYECIKPIPPKRERTPDKETIIDLANNRIIQPITTFEKQGLEETCFQIAKSRYPGGQMIKDEWESEIDPLNKTSPPPSMTLVDEVMDSYNRNYGNAVTVVQSGDASPSPGPSSLASNIPDETKTVGNLKKATAKFIFNEQSIYETDTNIPDDVKVSRSSYESLEAKKIESKPKSDDAKTEDLLVSHVTVTENGGSNLHSLELSINNEPSELYMTALDNTILGGDVTNDFTVIVSKPDQVKVRRIEPKINEPLVEITENSFSKITKSSEEISIPPAERKHIKVGEEGSKDDFKVEITESKYSTFEADNPKLHIQDPSVDKSPIDIVTEIKGIEDESPAISLTEIKPFEDDGTLSPNENSNMDKQTYVTEIQVLTPTSSSLSNVSNVSEVTVTPQNNDEHLESAFENYVKNFESKLEAFESNMQNFENNLEEFIRDEPKSIVLEETNDVEMQVSKIQEIAEEQLKTLPEMRFTTSSYETGRKTPEKRHSFELLRSNFEKGLNDKSPPRRDSNTPKSRIPIATTMKTPPMSPERRDSRNLENENDKAILELMSSSTIHSTPFTSKIKPPSITTKNVSVTSIKNNSKIPSGLPTLSSRPPIPPRKSDDNSVQVSTNGGVESSFKQWVFNPNSNVTNVTVGKEK